MRKIMKKARDRRAFRRDASRVERKNVARTLMRGGQRII